MKSTHILSASLPTVRPTSGGRIGPVFLTIQVIDPLPDLLIWLRFIHRTIVSPFILQNFSISLTHEWKDEKSLKRCWWIVMAYTYYVMLMAICMCIWLHHPLKLSTSTAFLPCTNSSQPGWFHVETCLYVCSWAVICHYSSC